MNHLQEAKVRISGENTIPAYDLSCVTEREVEEAKVHALIAIAEQLEIANNSQLFIQQNHFEGQLIPEWMITREPK